MQTILNEISAELEGAFADSGMDRGLARASLSNRPDLAEYQCNGAMAAAKTLHKNPMDLAAPAAESLQNSPLFSRAEAVKPGFLNLSLDGEYLAGYLNRMQSETKFGCRMTGEGKCAVIDYGGANVAKPLHVGHLRAAIIGESIKRIYRYLGWQVIGDVHLGDWGLQMGLIIEELRDRQPDLPYYQQDFTGEYPEEAPFTISDLEEIYPAASARAKTDEAFAARAHEATVRLQQGDRGSRALFSHILRVSVADLKKNYENLNVSFDVWKGESDAQAYIPELMEILREKDLLYESDGALVVDVSLPDDAKEIPPCLIVKSDGASLYATTDLATLIQREKDWQPDEVVYVVDKRQGMHFTQVFRTAKKAGIVPEDTVLFFLGFGTMNGKDGKPFKTREGGVMRLENLIGDISRAVGERIRENEELSGTDVEKEAAIVGLAALKYGDLSNQATKDYVFDVDRFISFEGNTGPYLLYSMVRIKSILGKYGTDGREASTVRAACSPAEKDLQLILARANDVIVSAGEERAPHRLCQYAYDICEAFNRFYHETRILTEEDPEKKAGWIALLRLTLHILETLISLLGFDAPEKM